MSGGGPIGRLFREYRDSHDLTLREGVIECLLGLATLALVLIEATLAIAAVKS